MKTYKVFQKNGFEAKGFTIKISDRGKIRIISKQELIFKSSTIDVNIPDDNQIPVSTLIPKRQRGRPKKIISTVEIKKPLGIEAVTIDNKIVSTENGIHEPAETEADIVNVGDSIEFTLNGEATNGEIIKEYAETQEMEVRIKGGLKLVIPAAWFIRKI